MMPRADLRESGVVMRQRGLTGHCDRRLHRMFFQQDKGEDKKTEGRPRADPKPIWTEDPYSSRKIVNKKIKNKKRLMGS